MYNNSNICRLCKFYEDSLDLGLGGKGKKVSPYCLNLTQFDVHPMQEFMQNQDQAKYPLLEGQCYMSALSISVALTLYRLMVSDLDKLTVGRSQNRMEQYL